jgi:hypothetical protein
MPEDELVVVVTDKDGISKPLTSASPEPGDRPRGIQFSTQQGSGFYTGSFNLSCPIDRDRDDLHLLDDVKIVSTDGTTVYEGFVAAMPRSTDTDGQGTLTIQLAGYMATAAGNPFTMIFVDRDLSQWQATSRTQQIANVASGYSNHDPTVVSDQAAPAVRVGFPGVWAVGGLPVSSAMYDAGPNNRIGSIWYEWTRGANVSNADANWSWKVNAMTSDNIASGQDTTANLIAAGPGANTLTTTAARRYAMVRLEYVAAAGVAGQEYSLDWRNLAVYGNHGLTLRGLVSPQGVSASDVIGWVIDNYCPLLSRAGVEQTTTPIDHLTFRDRTTPYDAMLKVNSYHLWDLAVWEDRTVYYQPVDLDEWDWSIRHDEAGNQLGLQGDEYTALRNGIVVQFTNVATGSVEELLPADHVELRDDSLDNIFNQHGWLWYGEPFQIPFPTTTASALELGRIRLLEDNQVRAPGSFTLTNKVRDRAGNLQSVANIRAGQRIRIVSSVNLSDRPRKITETQFSQDGRVITISVDSSIRFLEAVLDRNITALQAAGLS